MGLLRAGMGSLGYLGKSLYRGGTTRAGASMIIGGAALAGLAHHTVPAARDAAMDVAFGSPDADKSFLGRKLSPSAIIDSAVPGGQSGTAAMALGGIGAIAGAAIGGTAGRLLGKGVRGAIMGGIAGGIGVPAMAAKGYVNRNKSFMNQSPYTGNKRLNRETMEYSPWTEDKNVSLARANELNASGDIVLGMHNLKRGR